MSALLLFFFLQAQAEIWEKPPYIPDENHHPEIERQEETWQKSQKHKRFRRHWKDQEPITSPNDETKGPGEKKKPRTSVQGSEN